MTFDEIAGFVSRLNNQANDMSNDEFSELMTKAARVIETLATPMSYSDLHWTMQDNRDDLVKAMRYGHASRLRSIKL